jgi:hypothetical protein
LCVHVCRVQMVMSVHDWTVSGNKNLRTGNCREER